MNLTQTAQRTIDAYGGFDQWTSHKNTFAFKPAHFLYWGI